jgi:hypothetical protein
MKKLCTIILVCIFTLTIVGCNHSSDNTYLTIQKDLEELGYTIQLDEYSNDEEDFDLHGVSIISKDYRTSIMITLLDSKEAYIVFRDAGADILDIAKVFNKDINQLTGVSETANTAYENFMLNFICNENTMLEFATWFYKNNEPTISVEAIDNVLPYTPTLADNVLTTTINDGIFVITFDTDNRLEDMSYANTMKGFEETSIYNKSGTNINEETLIAAKEGLKAYDIPFYQYLMYVTNYYIQNKN